MNPKSGNSAPPEPPDDDEALPEEVRRLLAGNRQLAEARRSRDLLHAMVLTAREAVLECTLERFSDSLDLSASEYTTWAFTYDMEHYAHQWVHEMWQPAAGILRKLEEALGGDREDLIDFERDPESDVVWRETAAFVQGLFCSLVRDPDDRARVEDVSRKLGTAMDRDRGHFRWYHMYHSWLASRLERLAYGQEELRRRQVSFARERDPLPSAAPSPPGVLGRDRAVRRLFVTRARVAEVRGIGTEAFRKSIRRGHETWPKATRHKPAGLRRCHAGWWLDEIEGHKDLTPEMIQELRRNPGYKA